MARGGRGGVSGGHAAVVLAAGGSTRLGQPKQLLTRGGETLVRRAARLAAGTSPAQLLVVVGADAQVVKGSLGDVPCECVMNPDWRQGLASSLRVAGLHLAQGAEAVLVLACDQPALEAAHLRALLDGATTAKSGAAATLHAGAPGIPALVPRAWFDDLPETGEHGFGARLRSLARENVFALHAPDLDFDVDTPADLQQARERGWLDPPPVGA